MHSYNEDYNEKLTRKDTSSAIYSDWVSEMKRITKQKMVMMLHDNHVIKTEISLQKTSDKRSWIAFRHE